MSTRLSLDDDVARLLKRLRRSGGQSLKSLVNEALRQGLRHMTTRSKRREPFRTRTVRLGRCLTGNVDNVAEVLAVAEAESFK